MMKTVCVVFIVGFTTENLCASAQTHGPTRIPSGQHHSHHCTTAEFMCNNRQCISLAFRCDGDNDCRDRSDEENCRDTSPTQFGCRSDEFHCRIRGGCIPAEYRCDGSPDCLDDTDETECSTMSTFTRTSAASTILTTTPVPTTPSSFSASTWQHSATSTSTPPVEISAKLNLMHGLKTEKDTSWSEQRTSASHVQVEKEDKEYGYLDKINTMVAVIVGGVVITAIVISVAVVLVLKKRRTAVKTEYIAAKSEEHYDMPNDSCSPSSDNENVRTSNLYDFIPDSGDCSPSNYTSLEYTAAKENDYLTPVKESDYLAPVLESKEAPYNIIITTL